ANVRSFRPGGVVRGADPVVALGRRAEQESADDGREAGRLVARADDNDVRRAGGGDGAANADAYAGRTAEGRGAADAAEHAGGGSRRGVDSGERHVRLRGALGAEGVAQGCER